MKNPWKLALLGILLIPCWIIAIGYEIDLVNLYAVTQYLKTDLNRIYAQNANLGRYFYPPFSLVFFSPLGFFSFVTVKYFWIVLQTVSFIIFWKLLSDLYPWLLSKKGWAGWLIVFIVAINPIHNNFQSNNIQLMLACLLLGAEVLTQKQTKKGDWIAGLLVSLAVSLKVFPGFIFAYYLVAKNHRVRASLVISLLALTLIPFLTYGVEPAQALYRDFLINLTTYNQENSFTKIPDILCWPSFLARTLTSWGVEDPTLAIRGSILLFSGAFFLKVLLSKRKDMAYQTHQFAAAMALMTFLNPSTRPHYFIFYIPALASVIELGKGVWFKAAIVASTLLIAFTAQGITGKDLNDRMEFWSLPTYGTFILCLAILFVLKKPAEKA